MATLLPRLPGPAADILLEQYMLDGFATWPGFDARKPPSACRFAPTGGSRVAPRHLEALRDRIVTIARSNGFGTSDTKQTAKFDAEMAASLADEELFAGGEALRDDVWTFVATAIAPDVVHWRFPDPPRRNPLERYIGGVRNTFQRLWIRGRALDRGADHRERWLLLGELTEDALVQITERPALSANPTLARAIAEAWVRASGHHGRGAMETLMRRATKRIRALNEVRSVADLPPADLVHVLNTFFDMPHEDRAGSRLRAESRRGRRMFTRALPGVHEVLKRDGFDDVPEAEFTAFDVDAQRRAVWCVLSGEGAVPREEQDTIVPRQSR
ncbi:MAG: hypothetical protein OXK76_12060 [Gammaproteobacteria bacterium]|nr:hypothetical protein [Gammaproteobacteria bacterium]